MSVHSPVQVMQNLLSVVHKVQSRRPKNETLKVIGHCTLLQFRSVLSESSDEFGIKGEPDITLTNVGFPGATIPSLLFRYERFPKDTAYLVAPDLSLFPTQSKPDIDHSSIIRDSLGIRVAETQYSTILMLHIKSGPVLIRQFQRQEALQQQGVFYATDSNCVHEADWNFVPGVSSAPPSPH